MLKTLYTKWPAYESLTPSLETRVPDFIRSLPWHTNMSQVQDKQMLEFSTLLFSFSFRLFCSLQDPNPHFYLVPFKAFLRLYQLHHSRILKAKEPALCSLTLQSCMHCSTLPQSIWIVLLDFLGCCCECTVGSLLITGNSRTAATSSSSVCSWATTIWEVCYATCNAIGVLLSLQSPKSHQTPHNHSQEPSKLWTKINLPSFKIYFIFYVYVCMSGSLHVHHVQMPAETW